MKSLIVAILLISLVCLPSCTRSIVRGERGILSIGDPKVRVLEKLRTAGVGSIELVPENEDSVLRPSADDLNRFAGSPGLTIWTQRDPLPLRIDFSGDKVQTAWPPGLTKLEDLRLRFVPGTLRSEVLQVVADLAQDRDLSMAERIPNNGPFALAALSPADESYLLAHDFWRFEGLEEACALEPFYSRVRLEFRHDVLRRVTHQCIPFEMP
ncbi:MAG: hypothetical protein R3F35_11715 [Myxococcota bacterium]